MHHKPTQAVAKLCRAWLLKPSSSHRLWNSTVTLQHKLQACFRAVLDDPLVQDSTSQQMQRIRFLSLKNLGSLLAVAGGSAAAALDCYVSACELDGTDVVLWNRLGTLVRAVAAVMLVDFVIVQGLLSLAAA